MLTISNLTKIIRINPPPFRWLGYKRLEKGGEKDRKNEEAKIL